MRAAKAKAAAITWLRLADLRAALRWPWDHTAGLYSANDNGLVHWNGAWTEQRELASVKAYWRKQGWAK